MATPEKFYLSEFSAQGDEVLLDIPVCIPKTAFRIHPLRSRMEKAVYLKRSDDHWYLIHPDVARSGHAAKQQKIPDDGTEVVRWRVLEADRDRVSRAHHPDPERGIGAVQQDVPPGNHRRRVKQRQPE